MQINQFIDKWTRANRTERQAAQEHFIDLCRVLEQPTPNEASDPGAYSFEKGASKIDGSPGFADVWKRGHFGWEYKKDRANLDRAYQQLQMYSVALENPPLLVVSDTKRFRIYTNWTNTVQIKHEFALEELAHTATRELLRNVFERPDRLRPDKTREQVTKDAAKEFTTIAERLRMAGHAPEQVAHYLNRLVFCLFAEDVNLLENDLFKRMLDNLAKRRDKVGEQSERLFAELFREMRGGGNFGLEHILHFNGGLFEDDTALPLDADSLDILRNIAKQDWSAIDPSIFGTLFERFLDPDKRAQIGAHYTDPDKIMMIVNPVIERPLTAEWETVKGEITNILSRSRGKPGKAVLDRAEARLDVFLKRLDDIRVLDPACGSGNFLYMALQSLKDIEHRAIVEAESMGLARRVIHCGPHNVKGIEINHYAAELARTAIWIGNIQWLRRNGFEARKEPVLEDLDAIECRDALVTKKDDGKDQEAVWPAAEFIVGNPPFLGSRLLRRELGDEGVDALFRIFAGRVPQDADLVTYWFEKTRRQIETNKTSQAGLVATNSIRGGANRIVLQKIVEGTHIFEAWSDQPWMVEGASVRVSLIAFGRGQSKNAAYLDGHQVAEIAADLSPRRLSLIDATRLSENRNICFQGSKKVGAFDLAGEVAREFLIQPTNPHGRPNSDVLRPYWNGIDLSRRCRDRWIIDFGLKATEREASLFIDPFEHVLKYVKPDRDKNRRDSRRVNWWKHGDAQPRMRAAISHYDRYIVKAALSKHSIFAFLSRAILPDCQLMVFARDDYTTFGILHSRFHEAWSLRQGTSLEDRPRYTPTTTFETFPFPEGLKPNIPASRYVDDPRAIAIASAAVRLDNLRNAWLNPSDLVDIVPEIVAGYPDRILPKTDAAAAILKKRTLTNLYNQRPQWLADAHRDLDATVAAAYGWTADISDEEALAKLLELNLSLADANTAPASADDEDKTEVTPNTGTRLSREEFAKISEVEGLSLSDDMKKVFADFDRKNLTAEQRRQAIIDRFKRAIR